MVDGRFLSYLLAWSGLSVEWILFSEPQIHVQGVKTLFLAQFP